MSSLAQRLVNHHVVAVYSLYSTPEKRFVGLLARAGAMWRVRILGVIFPEFHPHVIRECRKQAGYDSTIE